MVLFIAVAALSVFALAAASPYPSRDTLQLRFEPSDEDDSASPQFPDEPKSCGVCQQNYDSIKLCLSVVPVMANSSTILANPGSFINVITCACTDPFKSTFPECLDCFQQTNQEALLNMPDPTAVIEGTNQVCALEGALFGVGSSSSITLPGGSTPTPSQGPEATPTSTPTSTGSTPAPTTTTGGAGKNANSYSALSSGLLLGAVLLLVHC
ncbi:hypothetical protein B0H17DRAFT_1049413 [Mycena rosella]|uniref:Uncharacterized protein n=1 Tax=Mycena rosella TaxID=1033263 RepID=A0AAD7DTF4_MYCRO|nr:hypothetical protein B0H17DRAFT_1049413 [Mycena rosella]